MDDSIVRCVFAEIVLPSRTTLLQVDNLMPVTPKC